MISRENFWWIIEWHQQARKDVICRHQQMLFQCTTSASYAAEDSMVTPDSQKAMVTLEGWSQFSILAFAPSSFSSSSCLCTHQHNHMWTSCAVFHASLWSSGDRAMEVSLRYVTPIAQGISKTWPKVIPSQSKSLSSWHLTGIKDSVAQNTAPLFSQKCRLTRGSYHFKCVCAAPSKAKGS